MDSGSGSEADVESMGGAGTPITSFPTSKTGAVPVLESPRRRSGSNPEVAVGGIDHRETPEALQSKKKSKKKSKKGSTLATAAAINAGPSKLPTDGDYVGIGGDDESSPSRPQRRLSVQPGPHLGGWILGSKRGSKSSITSGHV